MFLIRWLNSRASSSSASCACFEVSDFHRYARKANGTPVLVMLAAAPRHDPAYGSIGLNEPMFHLIFAASFHDLGHNRFRTGPILRVDRLHELLDGSALRSLVWINREHLSKVRISD